MKKNILLLLTFPIGLWSAKNNEPVKTLNEQKAASIAFTENKGQVHDQNGHPRHDVLYGAMAGNLAVHLKNTGVSYQLSRVDSWKEEEDPKTKQKRNIPDQQSLYRIDLSWVNANTNFNKTTDEALPGYDNYYTEGCPNGALNVRSYKGITLHNLYNGINLHYYEKEGQLKHDYIVAPHTDYKQIQLKVEGASIKLNNGTLLLSTPLGKVEEGAPIVFQNGRQLTAKWHLNKNTLSFDIENYNPNYELIIDPLTRLWGSYYGAPNSPESGYACATDASGNVFMTGNTLNTGTVLATVGSFQTISYVNNYLYDAYLVKFDNNGGRLWGTYYGNTGDDIGYYCSTDVSGNVYIAGKTESTIGIASAGSHQSSYGGGSSDAFLAKFDGNGARQWATYYGGGSSDGGYSCANDSQGNVYLTGNTSSSVNISTPGSYNSSLLSGQDVFLVKFDATGNRIWGTYYGGNNYDRVSSCAIDINGNVFIAGITRSTASLSTIGCHQASYAGGPNLPSGFPPNDAFLAKFNSNGIVQWSTYYGGTKDEPESYCSVDAFGNVYLTGTTASTNNISTPGSQQPSNLGGSFFGYDAYLVKFNSNGVRLWGTYHGGTDNDYGLTCSSDIFGNVYVAGKTASSTGFSTPGSHQQIYGGGNADGFFAKFNSNGIRLWCSYYGGTNNSTGGAYDDIASITANLSGYIYFAGSTSAINNIATPGTFQSTSQFGGTGDAYLAKFSDCAAVSPSISLNNNNVCVGSNVSFSVSFTGTASPTYSWSGPNGFTSANQNPSLIGVNGSNSGNYTLTVDNSANGGCIETVSTSLVVNPAPFIAANSGVICSGQVFTITTVGASSYTYSCGSNTVSPTVSTSYSVTGSSAAGCMAQNTAIVYVTVVPGPTIVVNSGTICAGQVFTINANGASSYTYSGGTNTVSPSVSTSYSVIGTNSAGCISQSAAIANVFISTNNAPTITVNSGAICAGEVFTITASGANTYSFSGGSNTVSPLITTSYSITGTDAAGCISQNTAVATIVVNSLPTISVSSGSICAGDVFTLTPAGASTYTISGGSNTVSPTSDTSYSITGTSLAGCVAQNTAVATISVNALPVISVNSGSICTGQQFTITASGAATYTYSGGNNVVSPPSTTSYNVIGTSSAGCISQNTAISTVSVSSNPVPTITVNSGTICAGDIFTITASGASTYTYSGGSNTVSPTSSQSYSVFGTSLAGCATQNAAIANVVVNPTPSITVNSGTICVGQVFTLTASGAVTYTFSGGSNTVSPSTTTTYSVFGSNLFGCSAQNPAVSNVLVSSDPIPTITAFSGSICAGQVFTITPGGATSYTYSSGSNTVSPLSNVSYSVTGTNSAGCIAQNTAVVGVTVIANPTITVNSGSVCAGDVFTIVPGGASTYTFSGGSNTVMPASSTAYTVSGSNQAGCVAQNVAFANVTVYARPLITANSGSVCAGKVFTLNASGASTYSYSGGSNTVSPTSTSSYSITGSGSAGCAAQNTVIVTVSVIPLPNVTISGPATLCAGSSASLTASGATTYTWSTSSNATLISISPTATSNYTLTGRALGCTNTIVSTMSVLTLPTTSIIGQPSLCIGNSATLVASGANSYTWNTSSNAPTMAITPTASTVYILTGQGSNGCTSTVTKTVVVNTIPTLTISAPTGVCPGDNAVLQVSGALTYTWSNNGLHAVSVLVTPTSSTTYTVMGTNASGCSNSAISTISVHPLPNVTVTVNSIAVCSGNSVTLIGSGALTYTWTGGVINNTPFVPLTSSTYTVFGTDANGCKNQATASITVNAHPTLSILPATNIQICQGESFTLSANGASSYSWNNGAVAGSIIVTPALTSTYLVTGTDINGCTSTALKTVNVNACLGTLSNYDEPDFGVYPNPTSGAISITLSENYLDKMPTVEVYNMIGQLIITERIQQSATKIDLGRFNNGVYFVKVLFSNEVTVKRILKN